MSNVQQNDQPTKSKRNSNTGGIHQLPSGSWELRWYVTDQSGNRKRVSTTVDQVGLKVVGTIESPIPGTEGNREFFLHLRHHEDTA